MYVTRPVPDCRHCRRRKAYKPRGLCFTCFGTPGVRDLFPSHSKYARRGLGTGNHDRPPPAPTSAPPGSPDKLAVLEQRAAAGQELWHPDDRHE
jgi:hypothetical protein